MITIEVKLDLYKKMFLTRRFEEIMVDNYRAGLIPGAVHSGIGQEGFSVGACAQLRKNDYLVFSHRGFGQVIAKGMDPGKILAEYMGKKGGCSKGKGGVHLSDFELGILGISGCQGGNHVIANGPALSSCLRGTEQVTACFFGDATANRGTFLEGVNLAAVWKLPVIFLCANNFYGFSTPLEKEVAIQDIAARASGLGIPGEVVDGNDVLAVYKSVKKAIKRARSGAGPSLIEGKTYRWRGHHEGDPGTDYRNQKEIEEWKNRCPIKKLRKHLIEEENLSETKLSKIEKEASEKVDEAVRFASESSFPVRQDLCYGTFYL